jgi:cation/acetate symporter
VYGQQLEKITAMEQSLVESPAERQVTDEYARRAQEFENMLKNVESSLAGERRIAQENLRRLNAQRADASAVFSASRELALIPKDVATAREQWTRSMRENQERSRPLGGMPPHVKPFAGDPDGTPQQQHSFENSRRNFLALMFCLMVGTAGLPHLLTRFYTTPTVAEARTSVAWSLFFIALLYLAAPALAVLVKFEVMSHLVGQDFSQLPAWMAQWTKVDPGLLSVSDVNGDHVLQFSELKLGADIVMLVSPELGGLPYIVSGLVAAGGLAAALSTADGLLLTIGNALAHDLYFRGENNRFSAMQRVMLSKFALLLVALSAAYAAAQKPADILFLVSASFSMAASAFVPVMVLGIFWARTTRAGAVAGMLVGLGTAMYYMLINSPAARAALELTGNGLWFEIQPISAGVFGVPAGVVVAVLVSLLYRSSAVGTQVRADHL